MTEILRLFVGFDSREAAAYHVFCQSVLEKASVPVAFCPLHGGLKLVGQRDGTNAFTFSRYLIPYLCDYRGWALFCDGDMTCVRDIAELWKLRDSFNKAVMVVQHDYTTKHPRKYIGSKLENDNIDYPRKNWSSVVLWNCEHFGNRILTPHFVREAPGAFLHRFEWLQDEQIGALPSDWNHLVDEYPPGPAAIYHHTLGVPGLKHYADTHASWQWHGAMVRALQCAGEKPSEMVKRAEERIGEFQ